MKPSELGSSPLFFFPKGQRLDERLDARARTALRYGARCGHPKAQRVSVLTYANFTNGTHSGAANVRVEACSLCWRVIGDVGLIEHMWPTGGPQERATKPVDIPLIADVTGGAA
ncbi:MAG: hypothetical protein EPO65_06735 [Dehalococcoidia bacterium]|nr:MAG: hypothetical protein EPO65_06735 [Dehalococcoidia bacterium]